MALLDAERLRVSCCCFLLCGMDATGTGIGEAGAVALGKALESGQCQLEGLDLNRESVCLAACGAGLCAPLSFRLACFCRSVVSVCAVRSGGRGWRCRMLTECGCRGVAVVCTAGTRQTTASVLLRLTE